MTKQKDTTEIVARGDPDPFAIRTLEQMLTLYDGGEFLKQVMEDHRDLLQKMQDHIAEFGPKGVKASFQISVGYELGPAGDLKMSATADFKPPKKPASQGHAFVDEHGQMSLYSPMMKRMQHGVRDVTPHDPETGEVRDT